MIYEYTIELERPREDHWHETVMKALEELSETIEPLEYDNI